MLLSAPLVCAAEPSQVVIPVIHRLVILFVARTTRVCRAGTFEMGLLSAVIAVKCWFSYDSCVPIFPAKRAVTLAAFAADRWILFTERCLEGALGLYEPDFGSAKQVSCVCPIVPQKVQFPPLFIIFPPLVPSHFCWASFGVFIFFHSLVMMMLCASLMTSVS